MDKREESRSERRHRRTLARKEALRTVNNNCDRVAIVLNKVRIALTDVTFIDLLRAQGVRTLPRPLVEDEIRTQRTGSHLTSSKEHLDEVSLNFVVAWTFLFPLFTNPIIATHMDRTWPGFILELKDSFIALVVEGPFPHAMSGHRGRRQRRHKKVVPVNSSDQYPMEATDGQA
jgi:hypothetical protein